MKSWTEIPSTNSTWSFSLERHKQTFGDVPKLYGSDRGLLSEKKRDVVQAARRQKSCAFHSGAAAKRPEREAYEKSREFKDGQRFSRRHRGAHLGVVSAVAA